ncbi:methionine aminopeptidase 1A [Tanacetum coccineum]|uniref:Methionine aminopeptidase 1A n=1 Tax=Tanacetum coccineum TaxID=301880 RepID=A0ABQ5A096_9ASTR
MILLPPSSAKSATISCWFRWFQVVPVRDIGCWSGWRFQEGCICRYKGSMIDDVPRIFEAVFQCTLEVESSSLTEPLWDAPQVVTCNDYHREVAVEYGWEIAREVLDAGTRVVRVGVTTDEIDAMVHEASITTGISVNEVMCHGIPDGRKLEDGDIVNIDVSIYYKGVHGDLNETYFVGNVNEASQQLVKCTYECMEKSIVIGKYCYLS